MLEPSGGSLQSVDLVVRTNGVSAVLRPSRVYVNLILHSKFDVDWNVAMYKPTT